MRLFSDPTLKPVTNESRIVKPTTTSDTFVARTLATPDTIVAWQSFLKIHPPEDTRQGECVTVVKLGSGVNGHIDICHGGFVSVLLDEVIGTAADNVNHPDKSTMTAYLKVDYKKPVPTPGLVLCRAWIERTEGRKIFGRGTVEDGEGTVMATGEALFVVVEKVTAKVKL
jgi:acyl-coenzyme A thioesterase PaaI-like protein